ncbi:MAG: hypothetical protein LC754_06340, partial [Acidobacteria bacterium]|nr:hypothetical protein [Acidobacteriota bacterium]
DGLREAVKYVCEHAPAGATIAHETPGAVRYYLEKFGRTDLRPRAISDPQFNVLEEAASSTSGAPPLYIILQRGRTYFENRAEMEAVRAGSMTASPAAGADEKMQSFALEYEVTIHGVVAAEVYRAGIYVASDYVRARGLERTSQSLKDASYALHKIVLLSKNMNNR